MSRVAKEISESCCSRLTSRDPNRHDHGGQISINLLFSVKASAISAMIMAEWLSSARPLLLVMSFGQAKVLSR
jgi:hypothetical protein